MVASARRSVKIGCMGSSAVGSITRTGGNRSPSVSNKGDVAAEDDPRASAVTLGSRQRLAGCLSTRNRLCRCKKAAESRADLASGDVHEPDASIPRPQGRHRGRAPVPTGFM